MPTYGQTESASAVNQQNRNEFQIDLGDLISGVSFHSTQPSAKNSADKILSRHLRNVRNPPLSQHILRTLRHTG